MLHGGCTGHVEHVIICLPLALMQIHYNSVYSADEPPPPLPAEKLLGSRRLWALLWGP